MDDYNFDYLMGSLVLRNDSLISEMCALYSEHYGIWGDLSERKGERIKLSKTKIITWIEHNDSSVAFAYLNNVLVGYAVVILAKTARSGPLAWVTQLVVHEDHRTKGVGRQLLHSLWSYSNNYAWGLLTANPYAVRALEKATRRRCDLQAIDKYKQPVITFGRKHVSYFDDDTVLRTNASSSAANTHFFIDHSQLPMMISDVTKSGLPWTLGNLEEGWEWFAFTFRDQPQIKLSSTEIKQMLSTSDQVTEKAFSRMPMKAPRQTWAQHTPNEIAFILNLTKGISTPYFMDLGCGTGRHSLELANHGFEVDGIECSKKHILEASKSAPQGSLAHFFPKDARTVQMAKTYDMVLCLYDVIGTYTDNNDNIKIIDTIYKHMKSGGYALISVLNYEITLDKAKHIFKLEDEPERLDSLEASTTMQTSGDIFNPDYYLLDPDTRIVYRKEQFSEGRELPQELLVRDRRFTKEEIEGMCQDAGMQIIWSKFVRAGKWDEDLGPLGGKEILVFCRKP